MAKQIQDSLVSAAFGLIEKEFQYLEYLELFRESLEKTSGSPERSGIVAFRAIVTNTGYTGGVIYPSAILDLAGEKIALTLDDKELLADPLSNASSKYALLNVGEVVELYYIVDEKRNTEKANELIETIAKQVTPLPFQLTVNSTYGEVKSSGTLTVETISFDLDFSEPRFKFRF